MNDIEEINLSSHDQKRSPFSLNGLEVISVIVVSTAAWFALRWLLQNTLPSPCGSAVNEVPIDCGWTAEQAWQSLGLPLYSTYLFPLVSLLAISAVFLVRSIRQDVLHFSVFGSLALAWPIIIFIAFFLLSVFSLYCFPVGLILAIIALIEFGETKENKWDWVAFPFSLIWLVVFGGFVGVFLSIYGD
jgi:hypothetical protein